MSSFIFPVSLDTPHKRILRALQLAEAIDGSKAHSARLSAIQGGFSETLEVELSSRRTVIVQFRYQPLDITTFMHARACLGDLVPRIQEIAEQEMHIYIAERMPGKTWFEMDSEWDINRRVKCCWSLGRALGLCVCRNLHVQDAYKSNITTTQVVTESILPKLWQIINRSAQAVQPWKSFIQAVIDQTSCLSQLPLHWSHFDLNEMNILVSYDGQVTGIIDWELSSNLPFGIGCFHILFLAGRFINGEYEPRPEFEFMERTFWDALINMFRCTVLPDPKAVQIAVLVGIILRAFELDNMPTPIMSKALPTLLNYQIPALRGIHGPFQRGTFAYLIPHDSRE